MLSTQRLRGIYRIVGMAFWLISAVVLLTAIGIQFRISLANSWQQYASVPAATPPSQADSILVFAPHADDETLGCGGMLATAKANGAKVHVVLMTNGDGFWFAASRAYKTIKLTPDRIVEFGYRRQQETLKALKIQGVDPSQVTFFGYPDRGLAPMWNSNWGPESLYTSRTTGHKYSPYSNSYTPRAPYCGESVLRDVSSVLKATKPTDIYIPHPLDNHPDHYATYCFVVAAMEQLRSEGFEFAKHARTHTYLVHRGDWPVPKKGGPNKPLVPPSAMASGDTKWESLSLLKGVIEAKRSAIGQYKTQTDVEKSFLMSFARGNELFGSVPERRVVTTDSGTITVDGSTHDWSGIPPVVVDPIGDYVVRGMNKGGDVRAIYACTDKNYLYLRLDCVRKLSRQVRYTITLRGINDGSESDLHTISLKPRSARVKGLSDWAFKGNVLEMALPMSTMQMDKDLFIQVRTTVMDLTVDNTGWHGLEMEHTRVSNKPTPKSPA